MESIYILIIYMLNQEKNIAFLYYETVGLCEMKVADVNKNNQVIQKYLCLNIVVNLSIFLSVLLSYL